MPWAWEEAERLRLLSQPEETPKLNAWRASLKSRTPVVQLHHLGWWGREIGKVRDLRTSLVVLSEKAVASEKREHVRHMAAGRLCFVLIENWVLPGEAFPPGLDLSALSAALVARDEAIRGAYSDLLFSACLDGWTDRQARPELERVQTEAYEAHAPLMTAALLEAEAQL